MAIITNIKEEAKKYVAVQVANKIGSMTPDFNRVERDFIEPLLGAEQYAAVLDFYNGYMKPLVDENSDSGSLGPYDGETPEADIKKLTEFCQEAVVLLSYGRYAPLNNVSISDMGMTTRNSDNEKAVNQWQFDDVVQYFFEPGFKMLDHILKYLTDKIGAFPLFRTSEAFSNSQRFIITSAKMFHQYVLIGESTRTFMALWPTMRRIENQLLRKQLGKEMLAAVKTYLIAKMDSEGSGSGSTSEPFEENAEMEDIIESFLKPAIAHLTLAQSMLELGLQVTSEGYVINEIKAVNDNYREKQKANLQLLSVRKEQHDTIGNQYLDDMVKYLNDTATEDIFPEWYESDLYVEPPSTGSETPTFTNDSDNKFYGAF